MANNYDRNAKTAFTKSVNALIGKTDSNNKQFADTCGIKPDRLSKLLSPSNTASPKAGEVLAVSEALDVSCDYLLGRATDPSGISDKDLINKLVEHFSLPLWFQILAALKDKGLIEIEKVNNKSTSFSSLDHKASISFKSDSLNSALIDRTASRFGADLVEVGNDNISFGSGDQFRKDIDAAYINFLKAVESDSGSHLLPEHGSSSEA